MRINTNSLLKVAEKHFLNHLKTKPKDDDEAILLAVLDSLINELGESVAILVFNLPDLPSRLQQIRKTINTGAKI